MTFKKNMYYFRITLFYTKVIENLNIYVTESTKASWITNVANWHIFRTFDRVLYF